MVRDEGKRAAVDVNDQILEYLGVGVGRRSCKRRGRCSQRRSVNPIFSRRRNPRGRKTLLHGPRLNEHLDDGFLRRLAALLALVASLLARWCLGPELLVELAVARVAPSRVGDAVGDGARGLAALVAGGGRVPGIKGTVVRRGRRPGERVGEWLHGGGERCRLCWWCFTG